MKGIKGFYYFSAIAFSIIFIVGCILSIKDISTNAPFIDSDVIEYARIEPSYNPEDDRNEYNMIIGLDLDKYSQSISKSTVIEKVNKEFVDRLYNSSKYKENIINDSTSVIDFGNGNVSYIRTQQRSIIVFEAMKGRLNKLKQVLKDNGVTGFSKIDEHSEKEIRTREVIKVLKNIIPSKIEKSELFEYKVTDRGFIYNENTLKILYSIKALSFLIFGIAPLYLAYKIDRIKLE